MNKAIIDASALLALIKEEPGAEIVEGLLGKIIMSSVNVSEVAGSLMTPELSIEECQRCILPFISSLASFDEEQAFKAASLKEATRTKGLSLGDRACIALGITMQLPIYTADRIWDKLDLENADIRLIR